MKNKLFCGILITLSIPVGHANPVTGEKLDIGTTTTNTVETGSGTIGASNTVGDVSFALGMYAKAYSASFAGGSYVDMDAGSAGSIMFGEALYGRGLYTSTILGSENNVNLLPGGLGSGAVEFSLLLSGSGNDVFRSGSHRGNNNIVLGQDNTIDTSISGGDSVMNASVLIGLNNSTAKTESWVIGKGNTGQTGTVTLGTYASTSSTPASLIVGTGTGTGARSNGLVVLKSGEVKIPGTLTIGTEPALTATSATAAGYLKRIDPAASGGSSSALLILGTGSSVSTNGLAIGYGANSLSPSGYAIGNGAVTSGFSSYALGSSALASGARSIALGDTSSASGAFSTAIGPFSEAIGSYSIALGTGDASGEYSVSLNGGVSSGYYSFSTTGGRASGFSSIAIGSIYGTAGGVGQATGAAATVIGGGNPLASGDVSFTSGFQTNSEAAHSAVFGSRNLSAGTALTGSATTWVENDALFEIGNGAPSASPAVYSNALTTLKNGRTTLANKFWSASTPKAVPAATDASAGEALVVDGHTRLNGKVTLTQAQGDISMGIYE